MSRIALFTLLAPLAISNDAVVAIDFTWVGPAGNSGNWSAAANWVPTNGPPGGLTDTATIDLAVPSFTVTLDHPSLPAIPLDLLGFTLDAPNGTLMPSAGQSRTIAIASGGTLDLLKGAVSGELTFDVTSTDIELGSNSLFTGPAAIQMQGFSNTLIVGDDKLAESRPLTISADAARGGASLIITTAGGALTLTDGSTFTVEADDGSGVTILFNTPGSSMVNHGLFEVGGGAASSGSATLMFGFDNQASGLFDVQRPTLLGSTGGGTPHDNFGRITLGDTLTAVGSFTNHAGGLLTGTGTLSMATAPFVNSGRFDPGVNVVGDMSNTGTAEIPVDIGGTAAGTFDQLDVSGALAIAGALELQLRSGFAPTVGDLFQIVDAGSLSGAFDRIVPLLLPSDQAIHLRTRASDMFLEIVAPEARVLTSPSAAVTFGDGTAYDALGAPPDTDWSLELMNVSGAPQTVTMVKSATIQSTVIEGRGGSGTIDLVVGDELFLGASHEIAIRDGGTLNLAGDTAEVFTQRVHVDGGTLKGIGSIEGDVTNEGLVAPGLSPGNLDIDGDYEQLDGTLNIEIGGTLPGEFDALNVSGTVTLDDQTSVLDVELVDLGDGPFVPQAGDAFQIITAGGGLSGLFSVALLPDLTSDELTWEQQFGSDALILGVVFKADFDGDGDVDGDDFLIWQQNFGVMNNATRGDGDADGDGDVDGNDFLVWQSQLGQANGDGALMIPEPETALLSVAVAVLGGIRRRRQLRVPDA